MNKNVSANILQTAAEMFTYLNFCPPKLLTFTSPGKYDGWVRLTWSARLRLIDHANRNGHFMARSACPCCEIKQLSASLTRTESLKGSQKKHIWMVPNSGCVLDFQTIQLYLVSVVICSWRTALLHYARTGNMAFNRQDTQEKSIHRQYISCLVILQHTTNTSRPQCTAHV